MYIKITRAFTLVELIICIALIAIMVTIALPYAHGYFSRQEAKAIPAKLFSINRFARSQAAVLHQNVVICPSQDALTCHPTQWNKSLIVFIDRNRSRQVDPGEHILHIDQLNLKYGNLSWRGTLRTPSITYQSNTGLPIGSNGSFYYCSTYQAAQQRIILSKMGHLRIEHLSSC
ncbi:GspH/FimT family protein [Acinetobacter sp. RF14B]|uniref:GspH/FimT family protein n=1 Tax=Acinetobacter sp. RF14B TaxID=2650965 RepID=UPI001168F56E|nr:GspH/FimT family protein [Acinetobacter sp. RF14B]TQR63808.1 prepilin-type N-terminal cleavage/methylation domain-containing protein [Acinetobacter sp. RF14B]